MSERRNKGEYPLNQSLFIVQGGFKSTCSGTRARPYGFITAVQIIKAQIPDMDHSSSAPGLFYLTSLHPPLFLSPLPVSLLNYKSQHVLFFLRNTALYSSLLHLLMTDLLIYYLT